MTTNYKRGYAFENKIVNHFRERDYFAVRTAGSHTCVDVIAWDDIDMYLIQAKASPISRPSLLRAKEQLKDMMCPVHLGHCYREVWVKSSVRGDDWIRYEA